MGPFSARKMVGSQNGCSGDIESEKLNNYGFKEVKILPGNIGYLKLDYFSTAYEAYEIAINSIQFLANTSALIIDLRNNYGGSASLVQFISTYFINENSNPYLLCSMESRFSSIPFQTWTLPYVPGKRLADTPVYVLTSQSTGSAAEAFAYQLKNIERITVIGETTAGAAHPVKFIDIGNSYTAIIPIGIINNPLTKTDWEGLGVDPNISVKATEAFDYTYKMALDSLLTKTEDSIIRFKINWALDEITLKDGKYTLTLNEMKQYIGSFGQRIISLKDNNLYYKRLGNDQLLIPIKKDLFAIEGLSNFRLLFERDKDNKIISLTGLYEEGRTDNLPKSN